jgi:hypothetical protein
MDSSLSRLIAFAIATTACAVVCSASPERTIANPQYSTWAKHKLGTSIVLQATTTTGGASVNSQIVQTLAELTRDHLVIEVQTKIDGLSDAGVAAAPTQRITIKSHVAKSEIDKLALPDGTNGQITPAGSENVSAAGKSYRCKVFDFSATQAGLNFKGKLWRSDEVPGGVVKTEMTFDGKESGEMSLRLAAIKSIHSK